MLRQRQAVSPRPAQRRGMLNPRKHAVSEHRRRNELRPHEPKILAGHLELEQARLLDYDRLARRAQEGLHPQRPSVRAEARRPV